MSGQKYWFYKYLKDSIRLKSIDSSFYKEGSEESLFSAHVIYLSIDAFTYTLSICLYIVSRGLERNMQVAPCLLEGPSLYGESTLVLENIYQAQIVYGVNKAEMRE